MMACLAPGQEFGPNKLNCNGVDGPNYTSVASLGSESVKRY